MTLSPWKGALGFAIAAVLVIWLLVAKGGGRSPVETWVKDVRNNGTQEVLRLYGSGLYKRVVGCDACDRLQQFGRWKRSPGHLELSPSGGGRTLKFIQMDLFGCAALVSDPSGKRKPDEVYEASIYFLGPEPCSRSM